MVMKKGYAQRKRSIVMPVLIASAVGAGIALLLAPRKGREIRKGLERFATNTRDQVAEAIDEGKDLYEEGREVVAGVVKAGRERYDEGTEMLGNLMHKKKRSLMLPIMASGIIGAGMALLLAKKSGKEVRGDIRRIAADAREKLDSAIDTSKVLYLKGKRNLPAAVKEGRESFVHKKEKLRHAS